MVLQVAAVMQDSANLNHPVFAATVKQEMPWLLNSWTAYPRSTELQMIGAFAFDQDRRLSFRAWPAGIFADIADGLLDQCPIARSRLFSKFPDAQAEKLPHILATGRT